MQWRSHARRSCQECPLQSRRRTTPAVFKQLTQVSKYRPTVTHPLIVGSPMPGSQSKSQFTLDPQSFPWRNIRHLAFHRCKPSRQKPPLRGRPAKAMPSNSMHNGLLLSALWDAAFDRGLVTFDDAGNPRRGDVVLRSGAPRSLFRTDNLDGMKPHRIVH